MKKIIIASLIMLSVMSFAQETSSNPFIYDDNSEMAIQEDVVPGNPGDTVPINEYIPELIIAALALIVIVAKRKKIA